MLPPLQPAAPARAPPDGRPPLKNMTPLLLLLLLVLLVLIRDFGIVLQVGLPEEDGTKAELPGMVASAASTRASALTKAREQGGDRVVISAAMAAAAVCRDDDAAGTAAGPSARFMTETCLHL